MVRKKLTKHDLEEKNYRTITTEEDNNLDLG
jgi:hypothetical protein